MSLYTIDKMKNKKEKFKFIELKLFRYKFDFLVFLDENKKIEKIKPFFGEWRKKFENKLKIKNKKIEKINFKDLKNLDIKFELYSSIYKELYFLLSEKRLYYYDEIAKKLNLNPLVLGKILNKNPFLILIPCHRVISKKNIGGYVLGEKVKKELLKFEKLL